MTGEKLVGARRLRRAAPSIRQIAEILGTSMSPDHRALRVAKSPAGDRRTDAQMQRKTLRTMSLTAVDGG